MSAVQEVDLQPLGYCYMFPGTNKYGTITCNSDGTSSTIAPFSDAYCTIKSGSPYLVSETHCSAAGNENNIITEDIVCMCYFYIGDGYIITVCPAPSPPRVLSGFFVVNYCGGLNAEFGYPLGTCVTQKSDPTASSHFVFNAYTNAATNKAILKYKFYTTSDCSDLGSSEATYFTTNFTCTSLLDVTGKVTPATLPIPSVGSTLIKYVYIYSIAM
jgi:hypothetical protein